MTFRSESLRRAVAELACVRCGVRGRTQAAHANVPEFGKGMAHKGSDAALMALCGPAFGDAGCHAELDSGTSMTRDEKRELQYRLIALTYVRLAEAGLITIAKR